MSQTSHRQVTASVVLEFDGKKIAVSKATVSIPLIPDMPDVSLDAIASSAVLSCARHLEVDRSAIRSITSRGE